MQTFGLMFAGVLLGVILTALLLASLLLYYSALRLKQSLTRAQASLQSTLARNTEAVAQLRNDISLSLSKLDADRLQAASITIQRGAQTLTRAVTTLYELTFPKADPNSPDYTRGADPEQILEEEAGAYPPIYDQPLQPPQPIYNQPQPPRPPHNQLVGVLTPEQIAQRQSRKPSVPERERPLHQFGFDGFGNPIPEPSRPLQDIDDTLADAMRDAGGIEGALI